MSVARSADQQRVIDAYVAAEQRHRAEGTPETLAELKAATHAAAAVHLLGDSVEACTDARAAATERPRKR